MPIRVGIVDDHVITRRSLNEYLRAQEGLVVVGEASNGRDAINLARRTPMEVMLLDIEMPGQSGYDSITHIRAQAPNLGILALSGHPPDKYGVTMLKKGAAGFLNKQCEPAEIVKAIRHVAGGQSYINSELSALILDSMAAPDTSLHSQLTDREFQVMLRLAKGQSSSDIGPELSLSDKTISSYRGKIMEKMGMTTSSELTYYAIKHGLID